MLWASCLILTLARLPQTHRGTLGQQQPIEMTRTVCPISWQKQIGSRVSRKPGDVIKFPVITALGTAATEHRQGVPGRPFSA